MSILIKLYNIILKYDHLTCLENLFTYISYKNTAFYIWKLYMLHPEENWVDSDQNTLLHHISKNNKYIMLLKHILSFSY